MRLPKSIRWRLQLWLAFLLITILSGFGVTAYQLHRLNLLQQIDEDLERHLAAISSDVQRRLPFTGPHGRGAFERDKLGKEGGRGRRGDDGPGEPRRSPGDWPGVPPPPWHPGWEAGKPPAGLDLRNLTLSLRTLSLFDDPDTNSFYYAVWSRSGTLAKRSTNSPGSLPLPVRITLDNRTHTQLRGLNREAFYFSGVGDCVLVGRSIAADLAAVRRFGWWLAAAGGGVLALGLGGGWLLITRAIRPIQAISASASSISAGNLAERINVADTDSELGRLAGVLNSTFARLEASFAQQKQFAADASHELRTPIAVIISEAQTVLAHERNTADYRESVRVCLEAAQQMRKLTQSLLQLARYDAGQEPLERSKFDLAERTQACVDLLRSLATERGLTLSTDLAPAPVLGDPDRVCQVITNLLANAIHYNKPQGQIRVSTRSEKGAVILTVQDTGQGIASQDLPQVFQRFFRVDKSRAHAECHHGLGLSICKSIVEAHGGIIEVTSQVGQGSRFTVRFPS
jgi:two-component system, OmpR family, sensor kinase